MQKKRLIRRPEKLFFFVLLITISNKTPVSAQTVTAQTVTAAPGDDFNYDGQITPQYGLKYTIDSWMSAGSTSWFSGWGG